MTRLAQGLEDRPADLRLSLLRGWKLTIVNGIHREGRNFLRTRLEGTSNAT